MFPGKIIVQLPFEAKTTFQNMRRKSFTQIILKGFDTIREYFAFRLSFNGKNRCVTSSAMESDHFLSKATFQYVIKIVFKLNHYYIYASWLVSF